MKASEAASACEARAASAASAPGSAESSVPDPALVEIGSVAEAAEVSLLSSDPASSCNRFRFGSAAVVSVRAACAAAALTCCRGAALAAFRGSARPLEELPVVAPRGF